MSLPDYLWVESPGTSERLASSAIVTKFGDGYEQSSPSGLNDVAETWDLVHSNVDKPIAIEIKAFLKDGMGAKRFNWTPPDQAVARVWKCTAFQMSLGTEINQFTINATFEQVFEP